MNSLADRLIQMAMQEDTTSADISYAPGVLVPTTKLTKKKKKKNNLEEDSNTQCENWVSSILTELLHLEYLLRLQISNVLKILNRIGGKIQPRATVLATSGFLKFNLEDLRSRLLVTCNRNPDLVERLYLLLKARRPISPLLIKQIFGREYNYLAGICIGTPLFDYYRYIVLPSLETRDFIAIRDNELLQKIEEEIGSGILKINKDVITSRKGSIIPSTILTEIVTLAQEVEK